MIFGVRAKDYQPSDLTPIDLTTVVQDLENVVVDRIEPTLRVKFHPVEDDSGNNSGALVVEIEESEFAPFALKLQSEGQYAFHRRIGQRTKPIGEGELAQMYRDRFFRQESITSQLEELSVRGQMKYVSSSVWGRAYVVAVPVASHSRLFRPTNELRGELHRHRSQWVPEPIFSHHDIGNAVPPHSRTGFKCLEFSDDHDFNYERLNATGWIEFHDNGSFLGVVPAIEERIDGFGNYLQFRMTWFTVMLLARLAGFWALTKKFDVEGEVILRVGLTDNHHRVRLFADEFRSTPGTERPIENPVHVDLSIDLNQLNPGPELLQTGKTVLDDLCTAHGWPECPIISEDGSLRLRQMDNSWRQGAQSWANKVGVNVC